MRSNDGCYASMDKKMRERRERHVFVRMRVSNSRWQDIKVNSKVPSSRGPRIIMQVE